MSQDDIMFNGESLPDEESYNFHHHDKSNFQNTSVDSNIHQKSQNASVQLNTGGGFLNSGKGMMDSSKLNNSQDATLSCNHSINVQQYEMLVKIQTEMQKVKEESKKIIEDNNTLAEKNSELKRQLSSEKN
mmetsp:Transcript_16442/g.15759  ORF Transcript_16442/g.15759 Transcript_16442/m.15759 type:complete len:131 (-) Transcript_16442:1957-2349(-)